MSIPRIYIIYENEDWIQNIVHRLEENKTPYALWNLSDGYFDFKKEPPEGIFYSRLSASSYLRGHRYSPEFGELVLKWLENHHRFVINGTSAVELEVSKIKQYFALEAAGIKTPTTVAVLGKRALYEAINDSVNYPFIIKPNRAGKGMGVQLIHSKTELDNYTESQLFKDTADGIVLLQQYIRPLNKHIKRSEFIGSSFVYTVEVDSSEGFELCPAEACKLSDDNNKNKFSINKLLGEDQKKSYELFLKKNKIDVAAVEWVEDEHHHKYVYDINTNTNYNKEAENEANIFADEILAKHLKKELEIAYQH